MVKRIDVALDLSGYTCEIRPAPDGQSGYIAEFKDVPGCFAIGATKAKALEAGEEALKKWMDRASILGIVPPKPGTGSLSTGHVRIRTPKSFHKELVSFAIEIPLSLNECVTQLLYRAVARNFDQSSVEEIGVCNFIGLSRQFSRKPKLKRFVANRDFSGSWLQRIPQALHSQLLGWSQSEGVTINLLVNYNLVREYHMATSPKGSENNKRAA